MRVLPAAVLTLGLVLAGLGAPATAEPGLARPVVPTAVVRTGLSTVAPAGLLVAKKAKKYATCKALNKVYKGGVAKSSKARNTKTVGGKKVRASSKYAPKVSASLYAANKSRDRDKDGIACER